MVHQIRRQAVWVWAGQGHTYTSSAGKKDVPVTRHIDTVASQPATAPIRICAAGRCGFARLPVAMHPTPAMWIMTVYCTLRRVYSAESTVIIFVEARWLRVGTWYEMIEVDFVYSTR